MRRRSTLALVGLASCALLVSACSSGSTSTESSAAASAAASAPAASAAASAPAASTPATADLSGQTLTVSNWAGYYPEDLAAQVQQALGVPLTIAARALSSPRK